MTYVLLIQSLERSHVGVDPPLDDIRFVDSIFGMSLIHFSETDKEDTISLGLRPISLRTYRLAKKPRYKNKTKTRREPGSVPT